jgi:hypothetical protein
MDEEMYVGDDTDQYRLEAFIAYTDRPSTKAADRGTAFHSLLEKSGAMDKWPVVAKEGEYLFGFHEDSADWPMIPTVIAAEQKVAKVIVIDGVELTVTGTLDAISAQAIEDFKTTASSYDYEGYANSAQWRLYCWITGIKDFNFHVFQVKDPLKNTDHYRVNKYWVQPHSYLKHDEDAVMKLLGNWVNLIKNNKEYQGFFKDKGWAIE